MTMLRKYDVFKKIDWAFQNQQSVSKQLRYDNIPDIDECVKLISECMEHLNAVYDYFIKDFVEQSGIAIRKKCYFPFKEITNNNPLKSLPNQYFQYINYIAKMFDTDLVLPRTNVKYNSIRKMRLLVNEGKHNKIILKMNEVDTGDLQYESSFGTVVVHGAEQLINQGFTINSHMKMKGKVPNLFFDDDKILGHEEREVTYYCTKLITGTKIIMKNGYNFIEWHNASTHKQLN